MKQVMGIINVNGESFYSESRCTTSDQIRRKITQMVDEGADILDFGACSTRPGSTPVSESREWEGIRLALSIVRDELKDKDSACSRLFKRVGQRYALSIDTFRSSIVEKACDYIGDFTINDISAGEDDPGMLPLAGKLKLPYIAMHKKGTPTDMQQRCDYRRGVVTEVIEYFKDFQVRAGEYGITEYIIDPGFGFAKTVEQNYQLLAGIEKLKSSIMHITDNGCEPVPVLIGLSRKSMIWKPLGITPQEALCPTAALNLQALLLGGDILRVHDVAQAAGCIKLYRQLAPYLNKDF